MTKDQGRRLKVGVLGCGPIAQAAHFESATKGRNTDLYAICDVAADLLERMAWTHVPEKTFDNYDEMLADPTLADAICDRLVHNAHVLSLKGPSIRKKKGLGEKNTDEKS